MPTRFETVHVKLHEDEYQALVDLSMRELRPLADHVRFILRTDLQQRGLLREVEQHGSTDTNEPR